MEPDLDNIRIVLVEPRGAFNIGSVARVMKNMGLSELALINPVDFYNDEAYKGAVGAKDVLLKALVFQTLEDAIRDTNLVVGTTRRAGKHRKINCSLEELGERIFPATINGKVALLFGREESGLTNRETDLCNLLVYIPANKKFPSLNLSHAVAVVCYRLFIAAMAGEVTWLANPATSEEIEGLLGYIEKIFSEIGFFSKGNTQYVIPVFRKIFGRALLDKDEVKNLFFIFQRLYGLYLGKKRKTPGEEMVDNKYPPG
jgi:tRNA/rRNA methyltransferase